MKNILITGVQGFIGQNLRHTLEQYEDYCIFSYDIHNEPSELDSFVQKADCIFHLAGVNRPENESEFDKGNRELTQVLLSLVKKHGKNIPFVMSSSIQAEFNNPYGISKKQAEEAVVRWESECGGQAFVFRLPNVFGKWCRPNYNSVTATFCHNIVRDMPISIHEPDKVIHLAYIDDVVEAFVSVLEKPEQIATKDGFCQVSKVYEISLQELADRIHDFWDSRIHLKMPDFSDDFLRKLYATYTSYLPTDEFEYALNKKADERGWLAEFVKSDSFGQIFVSVTKPGITRGNHWHHTKVEKFLVVSGKAKIAFRQIAGDDVITYTVKGDDAKVLDIPAGYTHSIQNIGEQDLVTIFYANEIFNQDRPDTFYLEVGNE